MAFANYTIFEKKRRVVLQKTTRRFVENDTLFYRKRHVVFLMPSRRLLGEYFLLPFSDHLWIGNRCLATSIPHPSYAEIDAEKHKQGVAVLITIVRTTLT